MAEVIDFLRALNAPPALGEFSAARSLPYMNAGIGTGGGMQLAMKDPQGIGQAAERWARARMETADPYAGLIWGDTIGGAQQAVLGERARQMQMALDRERVRAAQEREARLERQSQQELEARNQRTQAEFMARLASSLGTASKTNAAAMENQARLRQLEALGPRITREYEDTEGQLLGLQELLMENARQQVEGNPDLAVREGPDGLPELYSPTNRADANMLRNAESMVFDYYGPGFDFNPRETYSDLATQLSELDAGRKRWNQEYSIASRRPTRTVDTSFLTALLGSGSAPTFGQSAAQLLSQARSRGAAYRLPPSGPTGVRTRWTFDPTTRRVL